MFWPLDGAPRRVEVVQPTEDERLYDLPVVLRGEMILPSNAHLVIKASWETGEITCWHYVGAQKAWLDHRDED